MKNLLSSLLLTSCVAWGAMAATTEDVTRQLDKVLTGFGDQQQSIAGLVAIRIKDGKVVYHYSKKHPDIDSGMAYDDNTKFRIASISKLVVAIGVMQLVEQGNIDLDTDVSEYLGFTLRNPHYPEQPITPRMLLSHTSGILDGSTYSIPPNHSIKTFFTPEGEYWDDGGHFADPEAQNHLPLGEFFHYANLNFGVLGTMIERVSGLRFDQYMQRNVFQPMNIDAAYNVRLLSDDGIQHVSPLYRKVDGEWQIQVDDYQGERPSNLIQVENPDSGNTETVQDFDLADYQVGTNGTFFSPQGGLRISALDLAKIAQMLIADGRYQDQYILKPDTVALMEQPQWTYNAKEDSDANGNTYWGLMQEYGLSVHRLLGRDTADGGDTPYPDYQGTLQGHSGDAYGLLSGMYYNSDSKDGYIYFITGTPDVSGLSGNYSSFYPWEEATFRALRQFDN